MRTDKIAYGAYCNLLPSASLCASLCKLFEEEYPKVFSIFSHNILPYNKVDIGATAIPSLLIYPSRARTFSESWYRRGTLFFDFIYPAGAVIRERSTEIATVLEEATIYLILKNQNIFDLLKFGPPDEFGNPKWGKFPGLVELGENIESDFSDLNSLTNAQDSVRMRLRVSYTIDTVQWWDYIQEVKGHNIYDPCEFLYPYIEHYLLIVNQVSSLNNGE